MSCGCLILDVAMPEMTGPELLTELRRRGDTVPIVFITAQSEFGRHAGEHDAVACLLKPFSEEALLGAVRAALPPV
jgi:FixJ family two-component response regulator